MAFTGQKVKGSRVMTPETVESRKRFYRLMGDIKGNNKNEHEEVCNQMFWSMFEHLSYSSQDEFIKWAERVEMKTFFKK